MASDQYSDKKIVWILGSGFSVPLDGPTLDNLLSLSNQNIIANTFKIDKYPKLSGSKYYDYSYLLFNDGKQDTNGSPRMWSNAEEYLAILDTASNNNESPAFHKLTEVINSRTLVLSINDIKELAITTKRIIAAECSLFLQNKSTDLEEWLPYKQWAKFLSKNDTVLTFNYDLVLEKLANYNSSAHISLDGFLELYQYQSQAHEVNDSALVIKLHGSVNWTAFRSRNQNHIILGENDAALKCESCEIAIATPGPTKHEMVSNVFKPLWHKAEESLKNADAVVFMGYRFPPTDAEARSRLLGALMENESEDLRIFTILGPNDDPDSRRLETLLNRSTSGKPNCKVNRLPLWAQDFMSLYTPEMLFE